MKTLAKFSFEMDPPGTLNLKTGTSLLLLQELSERGQSISRLQQGDIARFHDRSMDRVCPVTATQPLKRGQPGWVNLDGFDAVLDYVGTTRLARAGFSTESTVARYPSDADCRLYAPRDRRNLAAISFCGR